MQRTYKFIWLSLCLLALVLPHSAYAFTFANPVVINPGTGDICPLVDANGSQLVDAGGNLISVTSGLSRRLVPCIESVIFYAGNQLLYSISVLMASTVSIACMLAVALWGVQMLSGKASAPVRDLLMLGIKIGAVVMFTTFFAAPYFDPAGTQGGLFGMLLDSINYMMGVVTTYVLNTSIFASNTNCIIPANDLLPAGSNYLIWDTVDCALEILIGGIFSTNTLVLGVIGFFVACLFSSTVGFFIGTIGFYLIVQLVLAIIRAMYIVVSSVMGFTIMIYTSPFWIPTILYRPTRSYFAKGMRLTAGFMIQPMVVAAYFGMLAVAFDTVVYSGPNSLYRAIAGTVVSDPQNTQAINPGFQIGAWLLCGQTSVAAGQNACSGWNLQPCTGAHQGAYCKGDFGSQNLQLNSKAVLNQLGALGNVNGGELGPIGQLGGCPNGQVCRDIGNGSFACNPVVGPPTGGQACIPFSCTGNQVCMNTAAAGQAAQYQCCNQGGGGCTSACVSSGNMMKGLGIGKSFFKVGATVTMVDWNQLATNNNYILPMGPGQQCGPSSSPQGVSCGAPGQCISQTTGATAGTALPGDPGPFVCDGSSVGASSQTGDATAYIVQLFLALLMAAITVYIFMSMLDALPFITAGISGNPFGTVFGTGKMIPNIIEKLPWNPGGWAGYKD